jgi:hypothetical protein
VIAYEGFLWMNLQHFYHYLAPEKVLSEDAFNGYAWLSSSRGIFSVSYSDYLKAWSEHDSIHYLLNLPFTLVGERKVAYVEAHCGVGWAPYGDECSANVRNKINFLMPKGFGRLKILETAEQLREHY